MFIHYFVSVGVPLDNQLKTFIMFFFLLLLYIKLYVQKIIYWGRLINELSKNPKSLFDYNNGDCFSGSIFTFLGFGIMSIKCWEEKGH